MSEEKGNDELVLTDDDVSVEGAMKIIKNEDVTNPKEIEDAVLNNLTKEEKKKIEESKEKLDSKKAEENKLSDKEKKLNYNRDELSEEEQAQSLDLQSALEGFIKDKAEMVPGSGVKYLLPTGIDLLDTVAGGGFAAGALTLLAGNPGTFKSALLAQLIATNQKKYRGKVLNIYMDSEEAMTTKRLSQLGVNNPTLKPYSGITIESIFKSVEALCAFKDLKGLQDAPSIIAWDSIANTITEKEKNSTDMDINKIIGLKARTISVLLPRYLTKLERYNIGLIVVNQLREKIDIGPFPTANDLRWIGEKTMPGGNALKFNAFHLLLLKIKGDLKFDQWGFHGVQLEAKFVKNKLFQPNIAIQMIVDFNTGVSNFWTNYFMLVQKKRLTSASWCSLVALPQFKFRTKEAITKYNEGGEFKKIFDEQVKDVLQKDYIDEYS